ncbi:hypothetical protein AMJ80_05920 [bacterium SM23_31]|nr:MAG: hypothetical protein AMJ80_05920 [bacterium SM23_31]
MAHKIIGTAGHIDHGKTALVKALTGTDTDRLKEEKEREITIDLGYAFLSDDIAFIDVPGHERFVKNMVAGVTGIDLALLVIAVDDGIMPQTREHLDIIRLLNIKKLVVALTKIDLVEEEWAELVKDEIENLLKGSIYEGSKIVPVSSVSLEGVDTLKSILIEEVNPVERDEEHFDRPFRMPVDRSFTMTGFGTVVTGTVTSGSLSLDDSVELLPAQRELRIRGLQRHNKPVTRLEAGERGAVNISGIQKEDIKRGDVIAQTGYFKPSMNLNCFLHYLKSAKTPLKHHERIGFHCGTAESIGRVALLEPRLAVIEPGDSAPVQIQLEKPVAAAFEDRFIIRHYSPAITTGGGEILEIDAARPRKNRKTIAGYIRTMHNQTLNDRIITIVSKTGLTPLSMHEIVRQFGLFPDSISGILSNAKENIMPLSGENDTFWIVKEAFEQFTGDVLNHILEYHRKYPDRPGMPQQELLKKTALKAHELVWKHALDTQVQQNRLIISKNHIKRAEFVPKINEKAEGIREKLIALLKEKGVEGPTIEEASAALDTDKSDVTTVVNILIDEGTVTLVGNSYLYLHKELDRLQTIVKKHIINKGSITIGEFRTALQTSRKYALPLLNYFDDLSVTIRVGDKRILK